MHLNHTWQGSTAVYLNDTYYQLAQRHPEVPRLTPLQTEVGVYGSVNSRSHRALLPQPAHSGIKQEKSHIGSYAHALTNKSRERKRLGFVLLYRKRKGKIM